MSFSNFQSSALQEFSLRLEWKANYFYITENGKERKSDLCFRPIMIKSYLDWNIFVDFRDGKLAMNKEDFLEKHKFNSLFPFSNVHFQDLYNRGNRDIAKVKDDLSLIDSISNHFFLAYDEGDDRIVTQYGSAQGYYEHYEKEWLTFTFAETFIDTLGKLLVSKEHIRQGQKILGLDPKVINNQKDVIKYFEEILPKTQFKKGFFELIEFTTKEYFKKEKLTNHDKFISAYLNLHILGYQTEKLLFRNILNDASHLFFGSACDFFVSHDKKLIKKAKILFEFFSIDCQIVSFEELLIELDRNSTKPKQDFLESIGIKDWRLENMEKLPVNNSGNTLYRKSLKPKLFGLFNEVKILKSKNHCIYVFMVEEGFHNFFYYGYEFGQITEMLRSCFGNDDDSFGAFSENDGKMVGNRFWYGRNWSFSGKYIVNLKFYGFPVFQIAS